MNPDDEHMQHDDERRPPSPPTNRFPGTRPVASGEAPAGVPDGGGGEAQARREVPWVRPSELPMVVAAPVLGKVVDRSLAAQSRATQPVVLAPAVIARAASRRVRASRATRRSKGLDR